MTKIFADTQSYDGLIEKYPARKKVIEDFIEHACRKYSKMDQESLEKFGFVKGKKQEYIQTITNFILLVQEDYQEPKETPKELNKLKEEEGRIKVLWDTELQEYKPNENVWIIENLIPASAITILTGKRGTLKTFMALLIAYCVASGINFFGKFKTQRGKVIYLDKENGTTIMKERTKMIKNGLNLNEKIDVGFICFTQLKIDNITDIRHIEDILTEFKPTLLIIDTYRRAISFDENDAGSVSHLFVDILRPLIEKYNLTILLIHHNRKGYSGKTTDEMDELRGSSDLANYVDGILKIERKTNKIILKQLKNRTAQEQKPIEITSEFTENQIKFLYNGEFFPQDKTSKCVELLTLWITSKDITKFETKEAKEIAFKKGVAESTFKLALTEMQNVGFIENVGFGLYKVNGK